MIKYKGDDNFIVKIYGGIAQLARAFGSYPTGRWFKSDFRYQNFPSYETNKVRKRICSFKKGPLVKRLRHCPFTAVTRVRFSYGSPKSYNPNTLFIGKCFGIIVKLE